jgi:thioredoxin 2
MIRCAARSKVTTLTGLMNSLVEVDDRGILLPCAKCNKRNRINYERLGQAFRCGNCHTELQPPKEPLTVKSETAFNSLTNHSALPVVVDFWADWCGPCKMVAPELVKVAAEAHHQCLVAKVNTEELPDLSQRFRIRSIPTLVLFQAGHEFARKSGAMPAVAIRAFIRQNLSTGAIYENLR